MISIKKGTANINVGVKDVHNNSGTFIDITKDDSGWYEIWLGEECMYIDTIQGENGEEKFGCIQLNNEELLTNKEWNEQ